MAHTRDSWFDYLPVTWGGVGSVPGGFDYQLPGGNTETTGTSTTKTNLLSWTPSKLISSITKPAANSPTCGYRPALGELQRYLVAANCTGISPSGRRSITGATLYTGCCPRNTPTIITALKNKEAADRAAAELTAQPQCPDGKFNWILALDKRLKSGLCTSVPNKPSRGSGTAQQVYACCKNAPPVDTSSISCDANCKYDPKLNVCVCEKTVTPTTGSSTCGSGTTLDPVSGQCIAAPLVSDPVEEEKKPNWILYGGIAAGVAAVAYFYLKSQKSVSKNPAYTDVQIFWKDSNFGEAYVGRSFVGEVTKTMRAGQPSYGIRIPGRFRESAYTLAEAKDKIAEAYQYQQDTRLGVSANPRCSSCG